MDENGAVKKMLWQAAGALLVAIVIQSGALLYWAGMMSARMTNVETQVMQMWNRLEARKP